MGLKEEKLQQEPVNDALIDKWYSFNEKYLSKAKGYVNDKNVTINTADGVTSMVYGTDTITVSYRLSFPVMHTVVSNWYNMLYIDKLISNNTIFDICCQGFTFEHRTKSISNVYPFNINGETVEATRCTELVVNDNGIITPVATMYYDEDSLGTTIDIKHIKTNVPSLGYNLLAILVLANMYPNTRISLLIPDRNISSNVLNKLITDNNRIHKTLVRLIGPFIPSGADSKLVTHVLPSGTEYSFSNTTVVFDTVVLSQLFEYMDITLTEVL